MSREAANSEPTVIELPVRSRIAALEARIAELEDEIAQLQADNLRLETELEEAEYTDETIAHIAGFIGELSHALDISLLPIRVRLAIEELLLRAGVARPWSARR